MEEIPIRRGQENAALYVVHIVHVTYTIDFQYCQRISKSDQLLQRSIFKSGHHSDFSSPLTHTETLSLSDRCHILSHE